MLREIADLGFTHAELSHGIRITLVPGILQAVEQGVIRISSTHNFCPLPAGVLQAAPNLHEPSAQDCREREQWLRQTKRTIDFSTQMAARVVVLHLGRVDFFWLNPAHSLRCHLRKHPGIDVTQDHGYQHTLARARNRLRKKAEPFWNCAKAGLAEIFDYAGQKNLRLGIENREKFDELPLDDEITPYLESLPAGTPAGAWHDTGHACIKQKLGVINHKQHLEKSAARLLGFHLHDVNAQGQDHQALGAGGVDFGMVSRFWQREHILVLELNPRVSVEEVIVSKARVESLMQP
ncbi:MAG: TIM barrel protein [Verrucomicrobiota bacterium]|nr:TIM barrel protein [Verrucomicrobiota bacterium]